jgi:outer membrane lipoprotein-sorting protein
VKAISRQLSGSKIIVMLRRKLLLRVFSVFLCLCLHPFCWAQQPSVAEILKRVSETYRGLRSYQFVAEGVSEFDSHRSISQIALSVANPGKIRLEVKDEDDTLLIVSDGQTKWTYLAKRKQYMEEAGSGDEVVSAAGRKSVVPLYRYQFEHFRSVSDDSSGAVLEREDSLKVGQNMVPCYVVKIPKQDGSADELWADESQYIVWKSRHTPPHRLANALCLSSRSMYYRQN